MNNEKKGKTVKRLGNKAKINELLNNQSNGFRFNELMLFLRSSIVFDTQKRSKSKENKYEKIPLVFDKKRFIAYVTRAENSIIHQRIFEAVMRLGKIYDRIDYLEELGEVKNKILIVENLYELKRLAGLNPRTSDRYVIKFIEDIAKIFINIQKVSKDGKRMEYLQFNLLGNVISIIEDKKAFGVAIRLNVEFLKAVFKLAKVDIDTEVLRYIHTHVKSAYVEKIIKFFLTQQTKSYFKEDNFWNLIKQITDIPKGFDKEKQKIIYKKLDNISEKSKRQILADIQKELEILKEFGITFDRKQLLLAYDPKSSKYYKSNIVKIGYPEIDN